MSDFRQIALAAVAVLIVLFLGSIFAVGLYTIDDVVTSGDAYGFRIGATAETTFETLQASRDEYAAIVVAASSQPSETLPLAETTLDDLVGFATWTLTLAPRDSRWDILRLHFDNGRLDEIYRSRRVPLELP